LIFLFTVDRAMAHNTRAGMMDEHSIALNGVAPPPGGLTISAGKPQFAGSKRLLGGSI
jgi:hypothetical protein